MEFRLLGPVEVLRGDRPAPLGGPKQRAVLAHLLLRVNDIVPTDRLIEQIWGEEPPEAARNALQSYVSRLRGALGESGRLERRDPGYVLRAEPDEVDALRFEAQVRQARALLDPEERVALLDHALSLWRGPPLADLADEASLRGEITRLEEMRTQAVEDRVEARLEAGAHTEAIPELEGLVERHPLRERLWGQLMVACYRAGRQAEALRAFDRARGVLVEELGVEPSAELQELYDRILRQDPDLRVAELRLRDYRLGELIGEGTFGRVHRAMEPQLGREVAVKVIRPDLADRAGFIRRFEAEAQLVARLEHPHIVPLYDYWREPGAAYLVMRLLRGGNLQRVLDGGGVVAAEAGRVVDQIGAALAFAHRQGVVHLDVKPENVLLDEEGNAYLSDFGIARPADGPAVSSPGERSSPYLAPEQLRGEAPGPHTDVYSLGVVAAELFGLGRGGNGESKSGDGVGRVIQVATAPDPADRYPDGLVLLEAFRLAVGRAPALPPDPEPRNPYKGLLPFTEADAGDFFGREQLVDRLLDRLRDPAGRFLVVVGPSGCGKSSVVWAGLIPALRRGEVPGSEGWLVAEMVPGPWPLAELEEALDRVGVRSSDGLAERLLAGEGLADVLERVLPPDSVLLLVVDQFEEAFALVEEHTHQEAFLDGLVSAVGDRRGRLRVLATLRADFYDRPLRRRGLADLVRSSTEAVTPLEPHQLEDAVALPASRVGVDIAPQLVTMIVDEVADQPGALPLLQYTLTELFHRRKDHQLTVDAYRAVGGVRGALVRRAEGIYERLEALGQEAARQLFLRLVTLGEGTGDTRRRIRLAEVRSVPGNGQAMESVLDHFGRHRLLSFDRDPASRAPTVEVAHEALLTEWGRLRGWIDGAREDVRTQRRLAAAAAEWAASGRDPSYLLRGSRLAQLQAWAPSSQLALSEEERAYMESSSTAREAEEAEQRQRLQREAALERRSVRRLRQLVAVLAAATLVAVGLTLFAFAQQRRADRETRIATGRELSSAAAANLEVDPERAILLALEAVEATRADEGGPLKEAVAALHQAVLASRVVMGVPGNFPAAFDPEGDLLATSTEDGVIRLWGVPSGEPAGTLEGHTGPVIQVEITPDGAGLVSSSVDGTARRWDLGSRREVCRFVGHADAVFSMSLSRDGRLLATRGHDDTVRIWDAQTCEERLLLEYSALGMHFHPEGDRLAFAGWDTEAVMVDVDTGQELLRVGSAPRDVRFSPDGTLLAVAQSDSRTLVVEADSGQTRFTLAGHEGNVETVDFSPDGSLIATGGQDGTVRVWEASSGEPRLVLSGTGSNVEHVTFDPSGRLLAAGGTAGVVLVWDVTPTASREVLTIPAGTDPVFTASYSPDGSHLAASTGEGLAAVWRTNTGEVVTRLDRHDRLTFGVWWSPEADRLITTGPLLEGGEGVLTVWDGSGAVQSEIVDDASSVAVHPSGSLLATGGESGLVRVWELTGELRAERHPGLGAVSEVAWSSDGRLVAAATQADAVWLWDPGSDETTTMRGHDNVVNALAWHPDGSSLASAGEDGTIRIWPIAEPRDPLVISGHAATVLDLAWSPDGTRLASAGFDGTIRIWDPESGDELLIVPVGTVVGAVSISPDGRHLVAGGADGLVRILTLDVAELVEIAEKRATRAFTHEECRIYLHLESCPDG
jgi:WD40 repeat protein/DNA-binding SARP family transcriptional activator